MYAQRRDCSASFVFSHGGLGKHFIIRSRLSGLILEVKGSASAMGTPVVTSFRNTGLAAEKQLFYGDESTGTIRTALNDYCIDSRGGY